MFIELGTVKSIQKLLYSKMVNRVVLCEVSSKAAKLAYRHGYYQALQDMLEAIERADDEELNEMLVAMAIVQEENPAGGIKENES